MDHVFTAFKFNGHSCSTIPSVAATMVAPAFGGYVENLSIADTSGAWEVRFDVADVDMSYIDQTTPSNQALQFRSLSSIDSTNHATIRKFESFGLNASDNRVIVTGYADIDKSSFSELRVGQPITGKINCGKRSLFFVLTRNLRDQLKTSFYWF